MRDWQDDGVPDVVTVWDKAHTAKRPHLCSLCNQEIAPGSRYRNAGILVDGVLEQFKMHGETAYPRSCPTTQGEKTNG